MRHPRRSVHAAAWHRARIEQQAAPGRRLWAATNYLASALQAMPPEDAERAAQAAVDDLVARADAVLAKTRPGTRFGRGDTR